MKKIYTIWYDHSNNIGDNIQSYVTKEILEDLWYSVSNIDQNQLHKGIWKNITVFINWFFCFEDNNFEKNFPFHKSITPIFYNFHLELDYWKSKKVEEKFFTKKNIDYFKKFEPIGCRDADTEAIFIKHWIQAINNECITLLLKRRTLEQEKNAKKIILVDVDKYTPTPEKTKDYEYLSHVISHWPFISNETKFSISKDILEYYKNNAKLVVTSRFHCAMPCIAMWIPVIMFWENNKRLKQRFIDIHPYVHWSRRHLGLLRKSPTLSKIPLLNINVRYGFTIWDLLYTVFLKIYFNIQYMLWIKNIDWKISALNFEEEKIEKIKKIKDRLSWT